VRTLPSYTRSEYALAKCIVVKRAESGEKQAGGTNKLGGRTIAQGQSLRWSKDPLANHQRRISAERDRQG
jgi:hypothetical protein